MRRWAAISRASSIIRASGNCYVHIVGDIIWIRAARNIRKGEELTYDYMTDGEGQDRVPLPAGVSEAFVGSVTGG